ncbi:XTP/dITP diphosphohydrolase [Bacilli bacterium PM5-9]|nr:XTP/dITP diphosphohydrolase [Bacilli bacterium PM5-9]
MNKLIVASNNLNKIKEIKKILEPLNIDVSSLSDVNIDIDVEETGSTFKENAYIKAKEIYDLIKLPVLSDDSGLEVISLNNEPGIYSARYAGEHKNDEDNIDKLLENVKGVNNRDARFVCAMALIIDNDTEYIVEGYLDGEIIDERKGNNGFGYDPIFYLKDLDMTLAEIDAKKKNEISHRSNALKQIYDIIKEQTLCQ